MVRMERQRGNMVARSVRSHALSVHNFSCNYSTHCVKCGLLVSETCSADSDIAVVVGAFKGAESHFDCPVVSDDG